MAFESVTFLHKPQLAGVADEFSRPEAALLFGQRPVLAPVDHLDAGLVPAHAPIAQLAETRLGTLITVQLFQLSRLVLETARAASPS
jgi:hypothetical protein